MAVESKPLSRRIVPVALLAVAAYYAVWGGEYTALDMLRLSHRQKVEAAALEQTRREADSLAVVVERLENDPAAIEAVARERFGMIRDGELLYRFVDAGEPLESAPVP